MESERGFGMAAGIGIRSTMIWHLADAEFGVQPPFVLAFSRGRLNGGAFRGLRKLRETVGSRFAAGVVLYDGSAVSRFDDQLFAVPVRKLWTP